jgi:hypothetical protein
MTSGLQASNMVASCCLANPDVISQLNKISMMELNECVPGPAKTISDTLPRSTTLEKHEYKKALGFLNRRVKLAKSILGRTYSMHPLRNAFDVYHLVQISMAYWLLQQKITCMHVSQE